MIKFAVGVNLKIKNTFSSKYFLPLTLVLITFLTYFSVVNGEFLYDDEFLLQKNSFLNSIDSILQIFRSSSTGGAGLIDSFYRPMQILSYLLVTQIFGKEPMAYHLLNIFLHSLNGVLIFLLLLNLKIDRRISFFAALLWLVHPVHTEAVSYMSATADVLHTFFLLLALFILSKDKNRWRLLLSLFIFCLALLSKESAVVLPGLLLTYLFIQNEDRFKVKTYAITLPFWAFAIGYVALRNSYLNFNSDFEMYKQSNIYTESILIRLQTFFATLPEYLRLLVWPDILSLDKPFPVMTSFNTLSVLAGCFLIVLGLVSIFLTFKNKKWLLFSAAFLWFMAAHTPQSGVLIPVNSFFLDHWMYIPSIAFIFAFVFFVFYFLPKFASPTLLLIASLLALRTYAQNQVWQNPQALYTHILSINPNVDRVRHNLAMVLSENAKPDEALIEYKKLLERGSTYPQTYHNMGKIYEAKNQLAEAEKFYLKAYELNPNFAPTLGVLSNFYKNQGDHQRADFFKDKYLKSIQRALGQ